VRSPEEVKEGIDVDQQALLILTSATVWPDAA
jgi:hypothetical protein